MIIIGKSKFNVDTSKKGKKKRTYEGITFASELELKFYRDYLLPQKEKKIIKNIILQPKYLLQEGFVKNGKKYLPAYYVGDFEVEYSDGRIITYDTKGLPEPIAELKRKLFDYKYPDKVLVWIGYSLKDGGWLEFDELKKLRTKRKKSKSN